MAPPRIELETHPRQGHVLPLDYEAIPFSVASTRARENGIISFSVASTRARENGIISFSVASTRAREFEINTNPYI